MISETGKDHGGVLNQLVAGTWRHPLTAEIVRIPIPQIAIRDTLDGAEPGLLTSAGLAGKALAVVSDRLTRDALGGRVVRNLQAAGFAIEDVVWRNPVCSDAGVEALRALTRNAEALAAVGSGTINDSVKYAAFLDGKPFVTFPTSPMTAHFTGTASVSFGGFKKSLTTLDPLGVFADLEVIAAAPAQLIRAGYADVLCRTTAQVDWLLSHRLLDTFYSDTAYHLLAIDEAGLLAHADAVAAGDFAAIAALTRMNALMGLGTSFGRTTHCGSMAEHMLSHYVDMFAGDDHPGSRHGEQVGVATLVMNRLQHRILDRAAPPVLKPTVVDREAIEARFGKALADACLEHFEVKRFDQPGIDRLNRRLAEGWEALTRELRPLMLDSAAIEHALRTVGAPVSGTDLGISSAFWRDAIRYARFTRDRFSMLDIAGDAGELDDFAESCS
ncbi:MAG: iron-containing alcohol dehydrogenase [Alphaproteobacteria bacterium]